MKIALYIEDGLEHIFLTPESDIETAILGKLHDGSRKLEIKQGSFFKCAGGWMRYEPYASGTDYYGGYEKKSGGESTMIVLTLAQDCDEPDLDGEGA
jgi:hypothetical protein